MARSDPSVALITRAHWPEAPFLNEFIAHYLRLGITAVYLINTETDAGRADLLQHVDPPLRSVIREIIPATLEPEEEVLRTGLRAVTEDWVLMVDMDEFLWLGDRKIQEFIGSNYDIYRFSWTLIPVLQNEVPSALAAIGTTPFTRGNAFKTLAKRSVIRDVVTPHSFSATSQRVARIPGCLAHVISRGLYDVINKMAEQSFDRHDPEFVRKFLLGETRDLEDVPFRIILLWVAWSMPKVKPIAIPPTAYATNLELLHEITRQSCRRFGMEFEDINVDLYQPEFLPLRFNPEPQLRRIAVGIIISRHRLGRRLRQSLVQAAEELIRDCGLRELERYEGLLALIGADPNQGFKSILPVTLAPYLGKPPQEIAKTLVDTMRDVDFLGGTEVLDSGEIRFYLR